MQIPNPGTDVHAPITPQEAKHVLATGLWDDDAVLKRVIQDAIRAENFEATKAFVMAWPIAAALYQSPYVSRFWEGTQVEAANVPFYTVALAVNSLTPQVVNGLFFDNPPFMIQQRPGTTAQAARAIGAVLGYQLEDINFREELRLGVQSALLFGTAIWKWGWESFTKKRTIYKRKSDPQIVKNPIPGGDDVHLHDEDAEDEEEIIEEQFERPTFEHIPNLRQVLVDPGLNRPDIQKAKYVIHRRYLTWEDLDKLRDRPGFDIPSREDLLMLFFPPKEEVEGAPNENPVYNPLWDARAEARYEETTVDPFQQPLEVLERWDDKRCEIVLQKKLVIANDENAYGEIPFLSVGWWDVPEAFWSLGLAKTIGAEQRLQQGITNLWLDQAAINLNGIYVRVKGKNVLTQPIRIYPGKIVEVDEKDGFKPLDRQPAVPEAGQHIAMSNARVEQISGASPITSMGQAGAAGHSNLARSSAGAQALTAGANTAPADFVEKLTNQVVVPFLYHAHEMNRAMLPKSILKAILNDELQHDYFKNGGDIYELLNARVKFSILAAAKMNARRIMAQALPILTQNLFNQQLIQSLAIEGKKVNVDEVIRMWFDTSEWKNQYDVIVPMTPDDQKRWQQSQPGAQLQAQAALKNQLQERQFQQRQELADQENISRAAREVLRQAFEKSATPETITGEPGGTGFGGAL